MSKKTVEETYQKKTQHEHILSRPDMYIGSCERVTDDVWVYDDVQEQMQQRKCSWIPGLYKIFDEILVNSADNKVRDPKNQTLVQVDIDQAAGKISVWNNGEGIPIEKHKKHNLWIPEMIFGHLLTSSNYDDAEKKVTGGRNGYGAKLTNVFSRKFVLETCHRASKSKFKMVWRNNMIEHDEPQITPTKSTDEDFTCVTFYPDFSKFGMTEFEDDIYEIMKRRVVDLGGVTDPTMKVRLNGKMLQIKNFQQYVALYPMFGEEAKPASFSRVNDRWEVCVRVSNIGFQQVSFVNSIATTRGGNHVKYITDQVVDKVIETAKKKHKGSDVKAHMIKPHLWIFVNCLIENPSFDSQTKETLNTTKPNFGSTCVLPQSLIDCVLKAGLLDRSVETANSKLTKQMMNKAKAGSGRITGIPKLEDANDAGGRHAGECTLILTEGDSAKALAVGGLGTIGRDRYGVFPLRGKPLNVRDAAIKKVMTCAEIQAIIKIMGLKIGQQYTSTAGLRYGRIMIMADQDHDGSHIKGLIVNLIHHFWPSLTKLPGFLTQFITPIVKATPKNSKGEVRSFFALGQFLEWRRSLTDDELKKYTFKYYKGLGTSTSKEGKEYFQNLREHKIDFSYINDGIDDERIKMAFAKDKVDDRKKWIQDYKSGEEQFIDYRIKKMPYRDFINKELIQFSIADCERSIPSVVDGFKPGQRKIMYCCFKRNLRTSIKVAQLAGYVSEHAAYHHGEASLQSTIVGLAQDYVGANNVPLLVPDGQFGTRLQGGKDCASARYIFTRLANVARAVFHKSDDDLLDYKDDDGFPVEPQHYVPVIPMVLVNGTSGIGTGFATSIPNYNPWDVIDNIRNLMHGRELKPLIPWYYGFEGEMRQREPNRFDSFGKVQVLDDMLVRVTELPIGAWTSTYKAFLEELMQKDIVLSFREHHTDTTVDFDIVVHPEVLRVWQAKGILESKLDLKSAVPATNLMCFDREGKLTKYQDAEAILKEFYIIRLEFYGKRKELILKNLRSMCEKLKNMVRFVLEVIDGKVVLGKKKKAVLLKEMIDKGFKAFPPETPKSMKKSTVVQTDENGAEKDESNDLLAISEGDQADSPEVAKASKDYDYLLGMKLWNLTMERVAALQSQLKNVEQEIRVLEGKTPTDLWEADLVALETALKEYYNMRAKEQVDAMRKMKDRRRLDTTRIKVAQLSDTARRALNKDIESADKKAPAKRSRGADGGDDDEEGGKKPAPKRKKAVRKKKSSDDELTLGSDSDGDDSDGFVISDSDDDDEDEDDIPLGRVLAKRTKLNDSSPVSSPKKSAAKKSVKKENDEDDSFDFDDFGLGALKKSDAAKPEAKKKAPAKRATKTSSNDEDKPKPAPKAKKAAAKKTAAPKKKKKGDSSDDDSESEASSFVSNSSNSDSDSDDDDDSSSASDSSSDSDAPKKKKTTKAVPKKAPSKTRSAPTSQKASPAAAPAKPAKKAAPKAIFDDDDFDFL